MSATTATESLPSRSTLPYRASWVDRLTDWVRTLPLPAWLFYLLLALIFIVAEFAVKWADGSYPLGQFHHFHILYMGVGFYALAAIHYLDDYAGRALTDFYPALAVDDDEREQLRYRLTTLPAGPAALCSAATLVLGGLVIFLSNRETLDIYRSLKLYTSPMSVVVEGTALIIWGAVAGPFIYHMYHQLHVVNIIYTHHTTINLFNLRPLYAFSKLTARASLILIFLLYPAAVTSPSVWQDPAIQVVAVGLVLVAIWNFIGPLLGIHQILAREKESLLAQTSLRLEGTIRTMDRQLDAGDTSQVEQMKNTLEALITRQNLLERIPTWPWSAETPRIIGTALLLPVILYVLQLVINRLIP